MDALRWPEVWPQSGPVVLRPWTEDDLPTVADLSTDPYVPLIGSVPSPFTVAQGRAYVARQQSRLAEGAGWSFAIAELVSGRAVGGAGLWLQGRGSARAGYAVAPADRGRGYAIAALRALTAYAWTLHLRRVELLIETWNDASAAVAARAGYTELQCLPRHELIGGVRRAMNPWVALPPHAAPQV